MKPDLKHCLTKRVLWDYVQSSIIVLFGLFLFALGWTAFLLPNELTGGGVAGLSAVFYFATGFPVGISTLVLNGILVVISFKILGPRFIVVTLVCSVILSFFLETLPLMFEYMKRYIDVTQSIATNNMFMSSVIGGLLTAVGAGIAINYGGNTGGTDIIVLMIGKYRNIAYGRTSMRINVIIVGLSFLVFRDVEKLLYSYIAFIVSNITSDIVIGGYRQAFQIMIFSKNSERIASRISSEIRRGVTVLHGYGWYTKEQRDVLVVILHRTEKFNAMQIIKQEDPDAFVSISKIQGVFGKNFDELKIPIKEKKEKSKSIKN
jgi:uncharacterized membrane-anchored protein YitT (DUF2179 family)